ncbi:MAG: adenosylcobinamide-GDP ribazoletransferase [Oligoflexia bacterium]|nr:adenosylcobinamide-GDP ribazoletransferase [Oligoflexia bacterium]
MRQKIITATKNEFFLFFTALMFFSRIPCPKKLPYSNDLLNHSIRYFPLIGMIIGGISAIVFIIASNLWNTNIAVVISMVATIFCTGAFHEDGLCDSCDGFGGGFNRMDVLRIMKDSRIGSYAAIGICLALLLKFATLTSIDNKIIPVAMICGHTISRYFTALFLRILPYAKEDNALSKIKPLATQMTNNDLVVLTACGLLPLFIFLSIKQLLIVLCFLSALMIVLKIYFYQRIEGYTGDTLGASQQLFELLFYLIIAAVQF